MEKIQTDESNLLTIGETIEVLRVGRTTVNQLLWSGALPSIKIGRRRIVRRRDLEEFLAEREYAPGER